MCKYFVFTANCCYLKKKSVYTLRSLIGLTKIFRPTLLLGKKEKKERNILCEIFYNLPQHLNIFINIFSSYVIAFYHSTHVVLHSTTVKQTVAKIMRDFNPCQLCTDIIHPWKPYLTWTRLYQFSCKS